MPPFPIKHRVRQLITGVVCLLVSVAVPVKACELSVGWEPWKPYQYRNADGKLTGMDVAIVRAGVKRLDCSLTFHQLPWKRTLFEIEQGGLVTVATGSDRTPEREAYAYFSEPYRTETVHLYMRREDMNRFILEDLSDIKTTGFRLGITAGYHYGDRFDKRMKDPAFASQVQPVRSDSQNHRKLMQGRIEGFLADPATTAAIARGKEYSEQLVAHPIAVKEDDIHVMFSRKAHSRKTVKRFNEALAELRDSGKLQAIIKRYLDY